MPSRPAVPPARLRPPARRAWRAAARPSPAAVLRGRRAGAAAALLGAAATAFATGLAGALGGAAARAVARAAAQLLAAGGGWARWPGA
jgi:hypothetical protein